MKTLINSAKTEIVRTISLLLRKRKSYKRNRTMLREYKKCKAIATSIPPNTNFEKKVLIIKTEDIGDYLLFRNFLFYYSLFFKRKGYEITLLGNQVWKEIFESYDSNFVDKTIWIDKSQYVHNKDYTRDLYFQLRLGGYAITICAERWRTLAGADCMAIAASSSDRYACANTDTNDFINRASNRMYNHIYDGSWNVEHEFIFNKKFLQWIVGAEVSLPFPILPIDSITTKNKIILNIGASKKTKKWPVKNWISLITNLRLEYQNYKLLLIGGASEVKDSDEIVNQTNIESVVGKLRLTETINLLHDANIVITNDSFALHAAASISGPSIIVIANGNNNFRFSDYGNISNKVNPIYPKYYIKKRQAKKTINQKWFYDATSVDIATISPYEIMNCVKKILQKNN